MDDLILMEKMPELLAVSQELGFETPLFLEDIGLIREDSPKWLLKKIQECQRKKKFIVYRPAREEMLRFALERTAVQMVVGVESIHTQDSVSGVRSGLDQVLCRIAAAKGKMVGISIQDLLYTKDRPRLLARIMVNLSLCKKYGVLVVFASFATKKEELRSKADILTLERVLR